MSAYQFSFKTKFINIRKYNKEPPLNKKKKKNKKLFKIQIQKKRNKKQNHLKFETEKLVKIKTEKKSKT